MTQSSEKPTLSYPGLDFWFCDAGCPFEVYLEYGEDDAAPTCSKCNGPMHLETWVPASERDGLVEALDTAEVALANCQNTADEHVYKIAGEAWKEVVATLTAWRAATREEPDGGSR